ncbi:salicylic acid-binding protein 2-like [Hibiscus syriacus]|uniref:Salicylic acid-binding protein 2-like n=1 Tax=Hibiscus syriacus TaxID=106335 RepID=A0A6A2ZVC9_HIBSY|nr:salicylic acid-binding protein 2-like [Hibiscus syriacus]
MQLHNDPKKSATAPRFPTDHLHYAPPFPFPVPPQQSCDVIVQNALVGVYSNCGDLESANAIFACIGGRDVAWNSMIFRNLRNVDLPLQNALLDMYCNCGDIETGLNVFSRIENLDLVSWNSMLAGLAEHGDGIRAMELFVVLKGMSFLKPDEYTFASVISATSALLASDYGKPLHDQITKSGMGSSVFVGTTLVSMYFKNGNCKSAEAVFSMILKKDVVLWTEMIMGYSRMADGESAIRLLVQMCQIGFKIDSFVLGGALSACADLAMLKQGEMIHSQAIKSGYEVEMSVSGSLIDMYAKNGNLQAAKSIFSYVSYPDLKCWNAMIGAYSLHGMAEDALRLFDEILKHELKPDQVTFLSLLSACSHSGLVERGGFFWACMTEMVAPQDSRTIPA